MTYTLGATSHRRVAARAFGLALSREMERHGIGSRKMSEIARTSRALVFYWRAGESLPRIETAERIADMLAAPALLAIVVDGRTEHCAVCQIGFEDSGGRPKRYCSAMCRKQGTKIRNGIMPQRDILNRRLIGHQAAVAAFCRSCEPDGLCRTPACPLRPVSPLPLSRASLRKQAAT